MAPEILDFGALSIQGYGLMIALGLVLAFLVVTHEARRVGLEALEQRIPSLLLALILAGFVGGKLLFVLGDPAAARELLERGTGAFLREGFVFYGSLLCALPAATWILRRNGLPVRRSADVAVLGASIVHAAGRVGCFLSGCCYGCRSAGPWAVTFRVGNGLNDVSLHATQLYEAAGELAIFAWLWLRARKRGRFPGQLVLTYLALYASLRLLTESLRGDGNPVLLPWRSGQWNPGDAPLGLTLSQAVSLGVLTLVVPLWILGRRAAKEEDKEEDI